METAALGPQLLDSFQEDEDIFVSNLALYIQPMKPAVQRRAQLEAMRDRFVVAAGERVSSEIETSFNPARIDHVWLTIQAGDFGLLRISLNTLSLHNKLAGFDPRVWLGILPAAWNALPAAGVKISGALSYAKIETSERIDYIVQERTALEAILLDRAARSIFIEAWGELHLQPDLGIHQVHSRAGSCAVQKGHAGRDGAVRFYFEDQRAEMLLFKFCGQL